MMKYFKNLKVGTIEAVNNEFVIAQMKAYPELYEEVKAPKGAKAEKKESKAPKAEEKESEAPKAEDKK